MKCKNNHESTATDFCSVCGIEMTDGAATTGTLPPEPQGQETCPVCGSVKTDNFCGDCGYNFISKTGGILEPPPLQPTVVTAPVIVTPTSSAPAETAATDGNKEAASSVRAESLEVYLTTDTTAPDAPQTIPRIFPLESGDYSIGRPSPSRKIKPSIPADGDDGVSHKHALIRQQGDSFAIMDLGSSNGTQLNGQEIIPNTVHTLKRGDVIAIGRWTRLTIQSRET